MRSRTLGTAVLCALAGGLAAAGPAEAGTVGAFPDPYGTGQLAAFVFRAADGERNDVRVSATSAGDFTLTDVGAPVTPGPGCRANAPHSVTCGPWPFGIVFFGAHLGDEDDALRVTLMDRAVEIVTAEGGAGDDVLDAREALGATLDGGGGTDALLGSGLDDELTDGDRDATADRDVIDGGNGLDRVDYRHRREPVVIDLAAAGTAEDALSGIEEVVGGAGPDRLAGDDGPNMLRGGPGRDLLDGRGGDDELGLPYDRRDAPRRFHRARSAVGDRIACGEGEDTVHGRRATDVVPDSCEWVVVPRGLTFLPKRYDGYDWNVSRLPGRPVGRRSPRVPFFCSDEQDWEHEYWYDLDCTGTIRLLEAGEGRRLLAVGTFPHGTYVTVRLRPTVLGRRLAARRRGVRARFVVRGRNVPTASWTLRWRLRR